MTPSSATAPDGSPDRAPFAGFASALTLGLGAVLGLAGLALAWGGASADLAGAALVGGGCWLIGRSAAGRRDGHRAMQPEVGIDAVTGDPAGRQGSEVMVAQVVPVWSRQLEVTRDAASDGLTQILTAFSDMTGALASLTQNLQSFSVAAEPGAVDGAIRSESPAMEKLLAPSARAFEQRDAAVAELGRCAEALSELQRLAKQAREIARHTRLVALNASIEAHRSQGTTGTGGSARSGEGGSQAVATEVRELAGRMAEVASNIEKRVVALAGSIKREHQNGELHDTSPDELRLELDLRAREALAALLGAVGASLQGSAEVDQASATLRDQLEAVFVHFQFGDRVSQMLSIIANDMNNFARWVAANPRATQTDAAEWLAALEASYTMDEQRSQHHGNVHVDCGTGVEFF